MGIRPLTMLLVLGASGYFRDLDFAPCQENPADPVCNSSDSASEEADAEDDTSVDALVDSGPLDAAPDDADDADMGTEADSTLLDAAIETSADVDPDTSLDVHDGTIDSATDSATDTKTDAATRKTLLPTLTRASQMGAGAATSSARQRVRRAASVLPAAMSAMARLRRSAATP
jgi:hypothetical protein